MGKKRDQELDLTPFIGLFAMLVVLLLVTASWSKLYSFKSKFSKSIDNQVAGSQTTSPEKKTIELSVVLLEGKVMLKESVDSKESIEEVNSQEPSLNLKLKKVASKWIESFGKDQQVTLESHASIKYSKLIMVYDELMDSGLEAVLISTENAKGND